MRRRHLPRYATQLLVTGSQARRPDKLLAYLHDVDGVRVSCNRPLPMHADGDDLGDVEEAVFGVARTPPGSSCELLFDLDGTLVDSRAVVERHWRRLCERLGLDFAEVLAVLHGVRSADVIRAFAPEADVEAEAAALDAAEEADSEGLAVVRGARVARRAAPGQLGCRHLRPPHAGAGASPRRRPAGARGHGVRRRGREGKPDPEGYLTPRGCSAWRPPLRRRRGRPGGRPGGACGGHARDRDHHHTSGIGARRREPRDRRPARIRRALAAAGVIP